MPSSPSTTELLRGCLRDRVLFPTHLVAGAVLGAYTRLSVAWLVVGAALPDLLDKPLATLGVTTLYHAVGHSALFGVVVLAAAFVDRAAVAVAVGWVSHVLLDAAHVVVNGRPLDALFLLWPVAVPPAPLALAPIPFVQQYLWSPSFLLEVGIWLGAGVVLVRRRRAYRSRPESGR